MTGRGLPRAWRLGRGSDIKHVLRSGLRKRYKCLDVAWCSNDFNHPRLGVIVPRHGRTAVLRNKVRRRLRECARSSILPKLSAVDLVVRARPSAYGADFDQLAGELVKWLHSFEK